tara:strand:- start:76 stop:525 length:450 start_codon:yes stop_codon:yes gene_type:complete
MIRSILLIIILFLYSCGYQPLYSKKNTSTIVSKKLILLGDKDINDQIILATRIKKDEKNLTYQEIELENKKEIIETSKDSKGQPSSYKMIINVKLKTKNLENNVLTKEFDQEFSYKNLTNKFELSEYQKDIENNLINRIIEEIIIYLNL